MKATLFSTLLTLFLILTLYLPTTFAQDYTQWDLPDGAKARISKGWINNVAYAEDGTRLAGSISIHSRQAISPPPEKCSYASSQHNRTYQTGTDTDR